MLLFGVTLCVSEYVRVCQRVTLFIKLFLKTSNSNFLLPSYTFSHFVERDANSHTDIKHMQ